MSERMVFSRLWDLGEYLCRSCYHIATQVPAAESIMVMLLSIPQGNSCTAKDDCGQCSSIIPDEHRENLGFSVNLEQVAAVVIALRYVFCDGFLHISYCGLESSLFTFV